jgi:hypothetical protein
MAEMDDEEMPTVIVVVRREVEDERDEGGDVSDGVTNGGRASRVVEEVWLGEIWEGFGVGFGEEDGREGQDVFGHRWR